MGGILVEFCKLRKISKERKIMSGLEESEDELDKATFEQKEKSARRMCRLFWELSTGWQLSGGRTMKADTESTEEAERSK